MNKEVSNKIQILSFYSIFMVVVCHAYNIGQSTIESNRDFIYYIEYLFAFEMSNIFIPMFFFISGYLFFANHDLTVSGFKRKIKNRFNTLIIPYILWCILWFAIVFGFQLSPKFSPYFDELLYDIPLWKKLWRLFVDPVNYTFWFIRELIFYVLATPLIYLGIKYFKFYFLIFLFALIFLKEPHLIGMNGVNLFQFLGLLAFSCGAYLSIKKINIISNFKTLGYVSLIILWALSIIINFYSRDNFDEHFWFSIVWRRVTIFIGFFTIWVCYDWMNRKIQFERKKLYSYRFFIYAAHGVFITSVTKLYVIYIGNNQPVLLLLFFIMPIVTAAICVFAAKIIQKNTPKIYSLLTGSR